jgi:hypothetical protein
VKEKKKPKMARLTAVCAAAAAAAGLASAATDGMDRARYGAVAAVPDALLPRYIVDSSFPIAKRVAGCDVGYHSCTSLPDIPQDGVSTFD